MGMNSSAFERLKKQVAKLQRVDAQFDSICYEGEENQVYVLDVLKLGPALRLANTRLEEGSSAKAKQIYQDILDRFSRNKMSLDGFRALSDRVDSDPNGSMDLSQKQFQELINLYNQSQL